MNKGKEILVVIASLSALVSLPARADPWIPPAGTGKVKALVRFYRSHDTFAVSSWGSQTRH